MTDRVNRLAPAKALLDTFTPTLAHGVAAVPADALVDGAAASAPGTGAKMVCDNLNALAAYLASEQHLAPESPWRIYRAFAFCQSPAPPVAARPRRPRRDDLALGHRAVRRDRCQPAEIHPQPQSTSTHSTQTA